MHSENVISGVCRNCYRHGNVVMNETAIVKFCFVFKWTDIKESNSNYNTVLWGRGGCRMTLICLLVLFLSSFVLFVSWLSFLGVCFFVVFVVVLFCFCFVCLFVLFFVCLLLFCLVFFVCLFCLFVYFCLFLLLFCCFCV